MSKEPTSINKVLAHIKLTAHNIQSGWQSRLEMAMRELHQMNVDTTVLMETKLTGGTCTRHCLGYYMLATNATSPFKGGIASIWHDKPN